MSQSVIPKSGIFNLPYAQFDDELVKKILEEQIDAIDSLDSGVESWMFPYLLYSYPTVYVVHTKSENKNGDCHKYTVYVGETNDIRSRTAEHIKVDFKLRSDWKEFAERLENDPRSVEQYVISNSHFNKSLTLDVENRLMHYLLGSSAVKKLNNRRANAQGDYFTQDEFERIFSEIWLNLHDQDSDLFPVEQIIRDSALFKASPFQELGEGQKNAENRILGVLSSLLKPDASENVKESSSSTVLQSETSCQMPEETRTKLIFVQGAAGTGKTVLLSHLFYRIVTEKGVGGLVGEDDEDQICDDASNSQDSTLKTSLAEYKDRYKAYILVNHHEQEAVYNQIATKLGLQKEKGQVVLGPSAFINKFSETVKDDTGKPTGRGIPDKPLGKAEVVLIDEAHLLLTQGNQGYSGKNQLHDILRRSKVVIAIFDPEQILQTAQQWDKKDLQCIFPDGQPDDRNKDQSKDGGDARTDEMEPFKTIQFQGDSYDVTHIRLVHQFRMGASKEVINWIDDFVNGKDVGKIPTDPGKRNKEGQIVRQPYEIRVFDSPVALFDAIRCKANLPSKGVDGQGLSRVLATYDWTYKDKKKNDKDPNGYWNVELHQNSDGQWLMGLATDNRSRLGYENNDTMIDAETDDPTQFCHPWNYQLTDSDKTRRLNRNDAWAEKPYTINEIGSTFTIQGFDLNYAGVIIGPSVKWVIDENHPNGHVDFDRNASKNNLATRLRGGTEDYSTENLKHELNILLKRGVHGLYLFAVDPALQKKLKSSI
jgi:DUF2075 family protein